MRNIVIGDVHGAGLELQSLLLKVNPTSNDKIYLVGDVFDRGKYGHLVFRLIKNYNITVVLGNHEVKMKKFLNGQKTENAVPFTYHWFLNSCVENEISLDELYQFLDSLPLMVKLEDGTMIVHAGICPFNPTMEDISWNVYGKPYTRSKNDTTWQELYQGDELVVYGHSVSNELPRYLKNNREKINSVGIDTAVVHGGNITAYVVETGEVIQYKSGVDYFSQLKQETNRIVAPRKEVMEWRRKKIESLEKNGT